MVLCTIQTSTSEYSANGAKRAHQTCIMNERMQPTLKRSAEISLTTGRGLSPDYVYVGINKVQGVHIYIIICIYINLLLHGIYNYVNIKVVWIWFVCCRECYIVG